MNLSGRDSVGSDHIMESAAKLISRHQPPLSVIMERSTEDTIASSSRPSSSASVRSLANISRANPVSTSKSKSKSTDNVYFGDPLLGRLSGASTSYSRKPAPGPTGMDSFASLSESQARDLFDNDAKDRIEFLASNINMDQSGMNGQDFNTTSATVNESLGAYFMRRSSHPVKGSAEESLMFNTMMDGTLPPDFDSTRSLSASTPLPGRSPRPESMREVLDFDDNESMMEQPKFAANESIVALYDYFKGPQSDGKRKDSMIDYVLEYCNQLKPQKVQSQPEHKAAKPITEAPVSTKAVKPRSPVKFNNMGSNQNLMNQSTTSTIASFVKPTDPKPNGTRLVRHVTESKTQLNLSIHEKSVVMHKKANQSFSKQISQNRPTSSQQPTLQLQPTTSTSTTITQYQQSQHEIVQAQSMPSAMNATHTQSFVQNSAPTTTAGAYPQYPGPGPGYGPPVVIQVYYPYPGQGAPQATPGANICVAPPPPQMMPYTPQPSQFQNEQPAMSNFFTPQMQHQPTPTSHPLTCEPRNEKPRGRERLDGLSEYKENVPQGEVEKPDVDIDKLALVWEGCSIGNVSVDKLSLTNKGSSDLAVKCSFTDCEPGIFMMNCKSSAAGLVAVAKTIIKSRDNRILRVAFRPQASGRTVGKLRLEFMSVDSVKEKDRSRRQSFVSYIPLVGFGYGHNDSSLV